MKKPIRKTSVNPTANTKFKKKYYKELREYYCHIIENANSEKEKEKAKELLMVNEQKLETLISNIINRMPKRKPLI